jgi:predicted nucleotidyltransferase
MTRASLLDDIVAAASAMTPTGTIRGYVFGSMLKPDFRWTDVDILIVCDNAMDVPDVRPALASVCTGAPVDLLVMSAAEESELNFVAGQGCRSLFELSL